MSRKTTYIVVEGHHDVEFIGAVLRNGPRAFHREEFKSKVEEFWYPLIPKSYATGKHPKDHLGRVPMPIFFQNDTHTVAVQSAEGISNIVKRLEETLAAAGFAEPDAIGLVLDSDSNETPALRAATLAQELAREAPHLQGAFPAVPGTVVTATSPGISRRGVFVFPDNASQGTLEDLLLECGRLSYQALLGLAEAHVDAAKAKLIPSSSNWTKDDHKEFKAPSGLKKATIASATAILKPGKTSQVSVSDNRWVETETLALPKVKAVADWLEALIF